MLDFDCKLLAFRQVAQLKSELTIELIIANPDELCEERMLLNHQMRSGAKR